MGGRSSAAPSAQRSALEGPPGAPTPRAPRGQSASLGANSALRATRRAALRPCAPEAHRPFLPPPFASCAERCAALRGQCAAAAGMGCAALALLLLLLAAGPCAAQYEQYSVRGFPAAALEPLQRAYARALAQYAGAQWAESARALEASLRLHRLLRDSEAHCHRRCAEGGSAEEPPAEGDRAEWEWERELQLFGRLLRRAGCLRACKRGLPVFQLRYPPAQTLRDFQRRLPYQYLHYALFKVRRARKCRATSGVAGGGEWGAALAWGCGRPPPCTPTSSVPLSGTLCPTLLPFTPLTPCLPPCTSPFLPPYHIPPSHTSILHLHSAPPNPAPIPPTSLCYVLSPPALPILHPLPPHLLHPAPAPLHVSTSRM